MDEYVQLLAPIRQFLQYETPDLWVEKASLPENLPIILKDHLLCELSELIILAL